MAKTIPSDLNEIVEQLEELGTALDISRRMSPRAQISLLRDTSDYLFKLADYLKNKEDGTS